MKPWGALAAIWAGCASRPPEAVDRARTVLASRWERKGDLVLSCEPSDATVQLDGVPQGRCADFGHARALSLGSGAHRVEIAREDFEPYQTTCELGGAQAILEVKLSPAAPKREAVR